MKKRAGEIAQGVKGFAGKPVDSHVEGGNQLWDLSPDFHTLGVASKHAHAHTH